MSPTDGTSPDTIVSSPTSLFPQQVNSWTQRMSDFPSPPRIPPLYVMHSFNQGEVGTDLWYFTDTLLQPLQIHYRAVDLRKPTTPS
jgi:hypothetical protein